MPPRAREQRDDDEKPAPKTPKGDICPRCFPASWPEGSTQAGCEHGQWSRDLPAPSEA